MTEMGGNGLDEGATVLLQEIWRGRLWAARPMTVVQDRGDLLALWVPAGTPFKGPSNPTTRARKSTPRQRMLDNLRLVDWPLRDAVTPLSTLWLIPPGAWFAARRSWFPNGDRLGWYVNFQDPLRRSGRFIRSMDLALDLVVDLDGTRTVKDQSDFDTLRAERLITTNVVEAVEAALADVHRLLDEGAEPFTARWEEFEPDPSWTTPALPAGWDDIADD